MRRKSLIILVFAVAVVTGPALAQEIIYFTNGTSMPVRSHEIEDNIIYVVLDGSASLAFPMDQVDRIETAEGQLFQHHESPTNQMVRPLTRAGQVSGSLPSRMRRGQWEGTKNRRSGVDTDALGVAVTRPAGTAWGANRRRLKNSGDRSILGQAPAADSSEGVIGTTRYGNKFLMPSQDVRKRHTPIGLTAGGNNTPPKKK